MTPRVSHAANLVRIELGGGEALRLLPSQACELGEQLMRAAAGAFVAVASVPAAQRPRVEGPLDVIERVVAAHYGIESGKLRGSRRGQRTIANARMLAMWLCRMHSRASYVELGKHFSRDHTTAMHACRQVERRLYDGDIRLQADVETIRRVIDRELPR